jgi:hypothetical protein
MNIPSPPNIPTNSVENLLHRCPPKVLLQAHSRQKALVQIPIGKIASDQAHHHPAGGWRDGVLPKWALLGAHDVNRNNSIGLVD